MDLNGFSVCMPYVAIVVLMMCSYAVSPLNLMGLLVP